MRIIWVCNIDTSKNVGKTPNVQSFIVTPLKPLWGMPSFWAKQYISLCTQDEKKHIVGLICGYQFEANSHPWEATLQSDQPAAICVDMVDSTGD